MLKAEFLTIFATFENLDVVKKTLPSVIEETKRNDARLIVHDSSVKNRDEKWEYLKELNKGDDFFLILSSNLSMAHARNMCLHLGQELYAPDYICMMEDDHGFNEGLIPALVDAMKKYYGRASPNGLLYGMFGACHSHLGGTEITHNPDGTCYPTLNNSPFRISGTNSCFRCAPTSHWTNVLKGYDTDEYLISNYQTSNLRRRNYNKGFTTLFVKNKELMFDIEAVGRGTSFGSKLRLWDRAYTASDPRSSYIGKDQHKVDTSRRRLGRMQEKLSSLKKIIKE